METRYKDTGYLIITHVRYNSSIFGIPQGASLSPVRVIVFLEGILRTLSGCLGYLFAGAEKLSLWKMRSLGPAPFGPFGPSKPDTNKLDTFRRKQLLFDGYRDWSRTGLSGARGAAPRLNTKADLELQCQIARQEPKSGNRIQQSN